LDYYPYMIYHVGHERNVFPALGIPSDEKVVAHALPKIETGMQVMQRQLSHGKGFLLGGEVGLADYYLLPSTFSFNRTPEGRAMPTSRPCGNGGSAWRRCRRSKPSAPLSRRSVP
jgi:glutathione S-transferase